MSQASPSVVVIGAGAAGIMAAWRAATLGAKVLLLEKTVRIGTKILVSGGGKCNITHAGPIEDVLRAFRPQEARFIRPSVYRWSNEDVLEMFTSRGLETYTRPDGRIFPVRQTAKDVVAILRGYLDDVGVDVRLESSVKGIRAEDGAVTGVETDHGFIACDRVVIATGGSSYPNSGTTGDGWAWAKALGHTIVPVKAALAPMYLDIDQDWSDRLSGVALRDIVLKARLGGKEIERWRGDLLLTHHGVSGPCSLGVSRVVAERKSEGPITLDVDLMPDKSPEQVAQWAIDYVNAHPKKSAGSILDGVLPEALVPRVFAAANTDQTITIAQWDKKARNRLVETVKRFPLGTVRAVPLEKGEVVAGGVTLEEVDPQTMVSKIVKGLFLCGEVLDIAGPVGGYNLTAAWATGYVAGESATERDGA